MPALRKLTAAEAEPHWKVSKAPNAQAPQPVQELVLPRNLERVLLLHPPIVDIRLPWVQYIQPTRLLRLATFFRTLGADVCLIDAVAPNDGKPLRRARARPLEIEEQSVNVWRFGITPYAIEKALRALRRERWIPDIVYVECATTFWWEGSNEVINTVKAIFPNSYVVLIGAYAELAQEHARQKTFADDIGRLNWSDIARLAPDLSHYGAKPDSIYLSLADGTRPPEEVVEEIAELGRRYNVQSFAFLDHAVTTRRPDVLRRVLEQILARGLKVRLSALGDLPMHDLVRYPDLASLMKRAGYAQLVFADDRDAACTLTAEQKLIEDAARVAELCRSAGFEIRTKAVTASLCIGQPGESLERRAKTATYLTYHLGSIIFWPYQPTPDELPDVVLEEQNGKLFPMRKRNRVSFNDYLGVLGLASVLNAKYRTATFDFLGDNMIARLFRESIDRQAWNPPEEVKGTLKLPVAKR